MSPTAAGCLITVLMTVGNFALFLAPYNEAVGLFAFTLLFGIIHGAMSIIKPASIAAIIGLASFGTLTGIMAVVLMMPLTFAPVILAFAWEMTQNYNLIALVLIASSLIGAVCF